MTSSNSLENPDLEKSCVVEYLECPVPTPICSGRDPFYSPIAISFAPKSIQFATPVTHGTLISEFNANLRNGDDTFPIKNFAELVITWPGLSYEWKVPMSNIAEDGKRVSRKALAQFVVKQFRSFVRFMSAKSSDSEWKLGEGPNAYSTKNTCLLFLFSPAPLVWQPAFRVRNKLRKTRGRLSAPKNGPELSPSGIPLGVVLKYLTPRVIKTIG